MLIHKIMFTTKTKRSPTINSSFAFVSFTFFKKNSSFEIVIRVEFPSSFFLSRVNHLA